MLTLMIRPFAATEWSTWRTLRLRALADSPDAFCASLAQAEARTDEVWAGLLAEALDAQDMLPLLAQVDGESAGLTWAQDKQGTVTLFQVWVAPEHRGRGVGAALLARAIDWARERRASAVELDVTAGDTPAVRLYQRAGFSVSGPPVPMRNSSGLMALPMRLPLA